MSRLRETVSVELRPHPATTAGPVRRVTAHVRREPAAHLALTFVLTADLTRLRVPPRGEPHMADQLWRHTCFEAFIAVDDTAAYHEFNFAPSLAWTLYTFGSYRQPAPPPRVSVPPQLAVNINGNELTLNTAIDLGRLSATHRRAALRLALSAVIEDSDGSLSYWALRHPVGPPDFHHPEGFALRLDAPDLDSAEKPG